MAVDQLLGALRAHLIAEGIVRDPQVAGSAPPMQLNPRYGVRAPGEPKDATGALATEVGAHAVIGAYRRRGIPPQRHVGFIRRPAVELLFRVDSSPLAEQLDRQIYDVVADRRGWYMGGLRVEESLQYRDLQLVSSDKQAYTFECEYLFEVWS